jgi:hypothetical protein
MEKAVRESDQMADQAELKRALEESHNDELQRAIKESSLAADQMFKKAALTISDLEAANFDLEQAVSTFLRTARTFRERYLFPPQYLTPSVFCLTISYPTLGSGKFSGGLSPARMWTKARCHKCTLQRLRKQVIHGIGSPPPCSSCSFIGTCSTVCCRSGTRSSNNSEFPRRNNSERVDCINGNNTCNHRN